MPDHILLIQIKKRDTVNLFQNILYGDESWFMFLGQVGLGDISGDDGAAIEADPGQKHFHLGIGGVLSLIQNDKSVVECASSHIGQRSNFYNILGQMKL